MKIKKRQDSPILEKGDVWYQQGHSVLIIGDKFSIEFIPDNNELFFEFDVTMGGISYTSESMVYKWEIEEDEK